jgi:eukaryotic-like serine/threonine-protein kinase
VPLTAGTRLGPYEIGAQIGAGGMGEVYRAKDLRLKRDVALKVLPSSFAADPDRLARFQREAEVLATLNHPHIAAIYGLEEGDGIKALVLELVEGETLADRIARGLIPLDEALPIAQQIAEALETAHGQGIIHRDLKPANIKIRPDGSVKVLDFGLAKLAEPPTSIGTDPRALSMSPTITSPARLTNAGVILGTATYMSPEQAKGRTADKRSDVWAFGCVLFEMLSGKRAFEGDDTSDTLASVLKGEPDWRALPAALPESIRALIEQCLERDRTRRIGDIAVARFVLDSPEAFAPAAGGRTADSRPRWQRWAVVGLVALAAAGLGGYVVRFMTPTATGAVTRLAITASPSAAPIVTGVDRDLAITPDGTRVVYVGANGQMFLRALDQMEPMPLTGLGSPTGPFVSPDGLWIGFFNANTMLSKVAITGGPPLQLWNLAGSLSRGGTWGSDGTIVFATDGATGLMRVPAEGGGAATPLTMPNREQGESDHLWPEFLPGGRAVLFTITSSRGGLESAQVAALDLKTGQQKILVRGGSHAHYLPSGYLLYNAAGTLRAVSFDADRLSVASTTPVPVQSQVATTIAGGGDFDVAANGTLVYTTGGIQTVSRMLVWVDRQGKEESLKAPPRVYLYPRLSPDGTRIALDIRDQENDIWRWDIARETLTRVTTDPALDRFPVWMPDGRHIVFSSDKKVQGSAAIYKVSTEQTGLIEQLTPGAELGQIAMSVSPDGTQVVFRLDRGNATPTERDLMLLTLDKESKVQPLVKTPFIEQNGMISPDGRWLAYESNETGQFEIYVRPFPDVNGARWQISAAGGIQPLWSRQGQELFYLAPAGELMSCAWLEVQHGRRARRRSF